MNTPTETHETSTNDIYFKFYDEHLSPTDSEKAKKNYETLGSADHIPVNIKEALSYGFPWGHSPEGQQYWRERAYPVEHEEETKREPTPKPHTTYCAEDNDCTPVLQFDNWMRQVIDEERVEMHFDENPDLHVCIDRSNLERVIDFMESIKS